MQRIDRDCDTREGMLDRIDRDIQFSGPLTNSSPDFHLPSGMARSKIFGIWLRFLAGAFAQLRAVLSRVRPLQQLGSVEVQVFSTTMEHPQFREAPERGTTETTNEDPRSSGTLGFNRERNTPPPTHGSPSSSEGSANHSLRLRFAARRENKPLAHNAPQNKRTPPRRSRNGAYSCGSLRTA
jgi:hypothetical protein